MSLKFHFHPLASFCQKVLIALYENDTPFEPHVVDLSNAAASAAFRKLWPIAKMPVLRDDARDRTIPESSIIIEYLAQHYPGRTVLVPGDPDLALRTRLVITSSGAGWPLNNSNCRAAWRTNMSTPVSTWQPRERASRTSMVVSGV